MDREFLIGTIISNYRKHRRIPVNTLAEMTGIKKERLLLILNNKVEVGHLEIIALSKALKVPIEALFGYIGYEKTINSIEQMKIISECLHMVEDSNKKERVHNIIVNLLRLTEKTFRYIEQVINLLANGEQENESI